MTEPAQTDMRRADALRLAKRVGAGEHELANVLYRRYVDRIYGYLHSRRRSFLSDLWGAGVGTTTRGRLR